MRKFVLAALLLCLAVPALAEDTKQYPLFSLARLHVGLRGEYEWEANNAPTIQDATSKQFRAGIGATYNLVPHLSGLFRTTMAVGKAPKFAVGVNWEVFNGYEYSEKRAGR